MLPLFTLRRRIARRVRALIGPALGALLFAYFLWHAVEGERGLAARATLESDIAAARTLLAQLQEERSEIENLSRRLRPDSLDLDLLEERAREMLNLAHPDEVIVLDPAAAR